ncbi:MAG: hypothetical protein V4482_00225 [Pseudomonadota bacterium]
MRNTRYYAAIFLMSMNAHTMDFADRSFDGGYHQNYAYRFASSIEPEIASVTFWGQIVTSLYKDGVIGSAAQFLSSFDLMADLRRADEFLSVGLLVAGLREEGDQSVNKAFSDISLVQSVKRMPKVRDISASKVELKQQGSMRGIVKPNPYERSIEAKKEKEMLFASQKCKRIKAKESPLSKANPYRAGKVKSSLIQQPHGKR